MVVLNSEANEQAVWHYYCPGDMIEKSSRRHRECSPSSLRVLRVTGKKDVQMLLVSNPSSLGEIGRRREDIYHISPGKRARPA